MKAYLYSIMIGLGLIILGCGVGATIPTPPPPHVEEVAGAKSAEPPSQPIEPASEQPEIATRSFEPESLKYGVVRIDLLGGGPIGFGAIVDRTGSGFDVITADHVLGDNRQIVLQIWRKGKDTDNLRVLTHISILNRDPVKDLAWLRARVSDSLVEPLQLGSIPEADSQNWPGWCYRESPAGAEFVSNMAVTRTLAKRTSADRPVSYWQLIEKVDPGMSGGPLFNSQGQWVGIASGNSGAHAYYIDERELREYLKLIGLN